MAFDDNEEMVVQMSDVCTDLANVIPEIGK